MVQERPVFRFAPSPNGWLHRGHALSALLNAALSKKFDGLFLLRIEDIDISRSRAKYISAIEDDLRWLGLDWQKPVRRQSDHMDDYARAFRILQMEGLVYPCFCSRRDMTDAIELRQNSKNWPHDPDGTPLYPGTCRHLTATEVQINIAAGKIPQARLKMDEAVRRVGPVSYQRFDPRVGDAESIFVNASLWGDVVLVRKDTPTSYHLSVVVDDAIQGVTHVVRGKDLEAATSLHRVLQNLLQLKPPLYWHHDLLHDDTGKKLAKSRASMSLREEIERGLTREQLQTEFRRSVLFADLLDF